MFSWGNKVASLAESLGQNTLKYRESRDKLVKTLSDVVISLTGKELLEQSAKLINPEAKLNFGEEAMQKKIQGFSGASDEERARVLANVVAKLKEERLDASVEGLVLSVKWTVPVVAAPVVAAPAVAVVAEKPAEEVSEKKSE
jgi:hypothetical protein